MGLTIHYDIALPNANLEDVKSFLQTLRTYALDLPFVSVSEIIELKGKDAVWTDADRSSDTGWLKLSGRNIMEGIDPEHFIAFDTYPAEGSETAGFGLCKYPGKQDWTYHTFCKTQYASDPNCGGINNFLRAHLVVVALLDKAKELGAVVEVSDESDYWDDRDVKALVETLSDWNVALAGFSHALEKLGWDKSNTVAPIRDFANYEYLEAEGINQLSIQDILKVLKEVENEEA